MARGPIKTLNGLSKIGRVQLSKYFFVRNFLNSEVANFHGLPNLVDDQELFIAAGEGLCKKLLDPIVETFGPIEIRSAHRSPSVNGFCNEHKLGCARNEANYAHHIWDKRDAEGNMGACASIVIPWFARRYEKGRSWQDLAWWVHDHLPYHSMMFYPKLAAFNLTWRENPTPSISSQTPPKGLLLRAGELPTVSKKERQTLYADFPAYRSINIPE
ncbi:MAG: hypothetical protein ACWA40_00700 [Planktomarina sp.]